MNAKHPNVRVVILAAGKGTRMKSEAPKALTQVGGRPILAHLLDAVDASGLDPCPAVVVGYKAEEIKAAMGSRCVYALQTEQLGTGHAAASAKEAVSDAEVIMILYGDHPFITAETMKRLVTRHVERQNTLTLMTTKVPSFKGAYAGFERWGRIIRGENRHIVGIKEYKDATEEERRITELNPSLFCFDAKWLWENAAILRNENMQKEYYLTDLVAAAINQGKKISSIEIAPEEVIGINTPEERDIAEALYTPPAFLV